MLPPAALNAADRLVTALMTLARAVLDIAKKPSTPIFPFDAAQLLLHRLTTFTTTLIRISAFGIRANPKPNPDAPDHTPPTVRSAQPAPAPGLPRHPGWLLAALPDLAPAIAADLRALLDDPAIATLLDAAPSLYRPLRPLLRALGLTPPPPPPSPGPPPRPSDPHPTPSPVPFPHPPSQDPPSQPAAPKSTLSTPAPLHDLFIPT